MSKITRKEIINDFIVVNDKFRKEFPNEVINRKYYTSNSKYGWKFENVFKDFTELKQIALKDSIQNLDNEKKIFKLKQEVSDLKEQKDFLIDKDNAEEKLLRTFKEHLSKLDLSNLNVDKTFFEIKTKKESILQISDIHAGETVKLSEMFGINEYTIEIMKNRLDRIFNDFIFHNKEFGITNTHLFFLGDIFSGEIHKELERTNEENIVEIFFILQNYFVEKLLYLANFFNNIKVVFIVGNHGRIMQGKPYYKEKVKMNYEYLFGKQMQTIFDILQKNDKDKKIEIDVPESAFVIKEVNGRKFLLNHGEIFTGKGSGGFAGIPYYSIVASAAKFYGALQQIGFNPEYNGFSDVCIGHLHSNAIVSLFNGGNMYVNGSIIGTSEYSLYQMKSVSKIVQNMIVVNNFGNVHCYIPLYGEWSDHSKIKND